MAETNANEVLNGENKAEENKTPDEKLTAPPVVEFTDTGGDGTPGEQPGQKEAETPPTEQTQAKTGQEKNKTVPPLNIPAPDVADGGDVVISSKDINGVFEEKRAAAKEAEKQAAEMDAEKNAPDKKIKADSPKRTSPKKHRRREKPIKRQRHRKRKNPRKRRKRIKRRQASEAAALAAQAVNPGRPRQKSKRRRRKRRR